MWYCLMILDIECLHASTPPPDEYSVGVELAVMQIFVILGHPNHALHRQVGRWCRPTILIIHASLSWAAPILTTDIVKCY